MNPPVESRPLRQFAVVAEELNFARAAERLNISAPALSRTVARLEQQLGVTLFERSTRSVALTAAGRVLYEESTPALDALDAAAARARRAAAEPESSKPLVLAVKADLDGGLLEESAEAYAREHDGARLELRFCGWGEQPALLRSGEADVALVYQPQERVDEREVDYEPLLEEQQLLAMPASHTFAGRAGLNMAELHAGHTCAPGSTLWVPRAADGSEGRRPRITDMSQLLKLVELGQLLALLPTSLASRFARPQIAYRPVLDAEPALLAVAWPRLSRSTATADYVRLLTDLAAARAPAAQAPRAVPTTA